MLRSYRLALSVVEFGMSISTGIRREAVKSVVEVLAIADMLRDEAGEVWREFGEVI